jgi:hypothetical protein
VVNNFWRAITSNYCEALQRTELLGLTDAQFVVVSTDNLLALCVESVPRLQQRFRDIEFS